jgi:hypothetical protein
MPCLLCAGKLMGQLHDRNCRQAFAPAEAFQADALPADRFQSEIQARTRRLALPCLLLVLGGPTADALHWLAVKHI